MLQLKQVVDMEGLPLDVILPLFVAFVGAVALVAYIARKLGSDQVCENKLH